MKRMLLLISSLAIAPLAHGMHQAGAEPEAKKQRIVEWQGLELSIALASQIETEYAQWLKIQDSSIVSLESGNGVVFALPIRIAQQSKTVRDLIQDVGIDNPIPLPNIDTETLAALSRLMQTIDLFQMMREKDELFYIPRALQPVFNQILAQASLELLAKLMTAANYLDHPFIMNGVAAIIVDRIPHYLREQALRALKKPQREEEAAPIEAAQKELKEKGLQTILTLNNNIYPWILKHLTHRTCGISEEYSVADYTKERGQPPVQMSDSEYDIEDQLQIKALIDQGLTSLYGIASLQHKKSAQELHLSNNCFYDFVLDPQPATNPFSGWGNLAVIDLSDCNLQLLPPEFFKEATQLKVLELHENELKSISQGAFTDLETLTEISLYQNELSHLPKEAFKGAPKLKYLSLGSNRINSLSERAFADLKNLKWLYIADNPLSEEQEKQIRVQLPGVEIESYSLEI